MKRDWITLLMGIAIGIGLGFTISVQWKKQFLPGWEVVKHQIVNHFIEDRKTYSPKGSDVRMIIGGKFAVMWADNAIFRGIVTGDAAVMYDDDQNVVTVDLQSGNIWISLIDQGKSYVIYCAGDCSGYEKYNQKSLNNE